MLGNGFHIHVEWHAEHEHAHGSFLTFHAHDANQAGQVANNEVAPSADHNHPVAAFKYNATRVKDATDAASLTFDHENLSVIFGVEVPNGSDLALPYIHNDAKPLARGYLHGLPSRAPPTV